MIGEFGRSQTEETEEVEALAAQKADVQPCRISSPLLVSRCLKPAIS